MNNDIKEILYYFRKYMNIDDCIRLSKVEDYISNLQEEIKKLKDRIHALEEHNKHLGKEAQKYFGMYMDREYGVKDTYDTANDIAWELFKEKLELEDIINRAIEYIDNSDILDIHHKNRHDLLDILKGDE